MPPVGGTVSRRRIRRRKALGHLASRARRLLLRARHGAGLRPGAVPRPVRCLLGQTRFRRIPWRFGIWPAQFLRARGLGASLGQAGQKPGRNGAACRRRGVWCLLLEARYGAAYRRHGVVPSIDGTVCRRRIRRRPAEPPANRPAEKRGGGLVAAGPFGPAEGAARPFGRADV